jgi:hypothetical protein
MLVFLLAFMSVFPLVFMLVCHRGYAPTARAKMRRLWGFSREGDVEEPDGPEVEKCCFVLCSFS